MKRQSKDMPPKTVGEVCQIVNIIFSGFYDRSAFKN